MPAADPLIGQIIGDRYQVIRLIGSGAMGAVYEVNQRRIGRSFALKRLAPGLAASPEALARFRREAEVVARLRHPNIVEVIDWETLSDGSPCIIMEYLRGEDLAGRLLRGALGWAEVAEIGGQILSALSVAHRAGIVHRDLKPQNIFLARDDAGERHVKLLDFGVSKIKDAEVRLTTQDRLIGTPLYMSPEQAEGKPELIGPPIDVWAMGAILFEMATGEVAFGAQTLPAVLYRICHGKPESLIERRPDAPAGFVALVEDTLSHDRARRVLDIEVMRRRFAEAVGRAPAAAPSVEKKPAAEAGPVSAFGSTAAQAPVKSVTSTLSAAAGERTSELRRELFPARPRWPLIAGAAAAVAAAAGVWIALARHPTVGPAPLAIGANGTAKAPGQNATNGQNGATAAPAAPAADGANGASKTPPASGAAKTPANGIAKAHGQNGQNSQSAARSGARIRVHVTRSPADARLTLDGTPVGEDFAFTDDGGSHVLTVTADGYAPLRRALDRATARALDVNLTPLAHKPRAHENLEPPFINP